MSEIEDWYDRNRPENVNPHMSRIDIVGQNGNTGEHYTDITESVHGAQLVEEHWKYIEGLLRASIPPENVFTYDVDEIVNLIKFHYRTAGLHFWKHAFEYMEEKEK